MSSVEVAIVGGGYTGLSAAYHLAREHGIRAAVLEAGRSAGAPSGRNGGFLRPGWHPASAMPPWPAGGRVQEARRFFDAQTSRAADPGGLAAEEGFDLGIAGEGEHYIAHRPAAGYELENQRGHRPATVRRALGAGARPRWRSGRRARPRQFGRLVVPHNFGFNPMRLRARARGCHCCAAPVYIRRRRSPRGSAPGNATGSSRRAGW
ncbi:MAG: FAD-binding oxidoreductase [Geminicoccaceae bacterium]